jgi:hypothetical protein
MTEYPWDARQKPTETVGSLRDRAASLRWAAESMQDTDRAHELRRFAEQLEQQAAVLEQRLTDPHSPLE